MRQKVSYTRYTFRVTLVPLEGEPKVTKVTQELLMEQIRDAIALRIPTQAGVRVEMICKTQVYQGGEDD